MSDQLDDRLDEIYLSVLNYESDRVAELVRKEVEYGTDINVILNDALIAAMGEVGDEFSNGRLFVPEMLLAATAMRSGLDVLRPLLTGTTTKPIGRIVIGTVKGDMHDIGKNLVGMMLEGGGFELIDLGVDVAADDFVSAAREHQATAVALSALLTTTMPNMRKVVEALKRAGYNGGIMVGGAPLNAEFAAAIGASGFAPDAPGAVRLARRFVADSPAAIV